MGGARAVWIGRRRYAPIHDLQRRIVEARQAGRVGDVILLLEHEPVITLGRGAQPGNVLLGPGALEARGVDLVETGRGGDVTYHGPGQLVGYPLLPLRPVRSSENVEFQSLVFAHSPDSTRDTMRPDRSRIPDADYVGYVRNLEKTLIIALANLGLAAGQRPGLTGVWVQADVHSRCPRCKPEDRRKPAKIAAIGVKVDARGVSRHGFALNVNPDMDYWDGIIACGLQDEPVASLADLMPDPPSMERVKAEVVKAFGEVFGMSPAH